MIIISIFNYEFFTLTTVTAAINSLRSRYATTGFYKNDYIKTFRR